MAALHHLDDSRRVRLNKGGYWPLYEHSEDYTAQVLNVLKPD